MQQPSRTNSLGGNFYALVIVDDFYRFTLTLFLACKNDSDLALKILDKVLENEKNSIIVFIQSYHWRDFQNEKFESFCEKHGIKHNFSTPKTPQQNEMVERKNKSLEELARSMLNENLLSKYFWADAVNITNYALSNKREIVSINGFEG